MVHDDGPVGLDGVQVSLSSDAGIALVATLCRATGIEGVAQRLGQASVAL